MLRDRLQGGSRRCFVQANTATLLDRLGKWLLPGSPAAGGVSSYLVNDSAKQALARVPIKVILSCVSASS